MNGREYQYQSQMNTRIFSRLIPLGRLSAAIVTAGSLCVAAWGQGDNGAPTDSQEAQALSTLQRALQQNMQSANAVGRGGTFVEVEPSSGGPPFVTTMSAEPRFDLEVSNGFIVMPPHRPELRAATVRHLVDILEDEVTNFNVIVPPSVASVQLGDFKLRGVGAVTVLNILPSITDNKVTAGALTGARGRRGGPGALTTAGGIQDGVVYRLQLIPANNPYNINGTGGSAPTASDTPERQMAAFNIKNYLADLARHGKSDESALEAAFGDLQNVINDSLQRLKGSPLTREEQPEIEFHHGAGIMIVIGSPKAIDVATKIINALQGNENNPASDEIDKWLKANGQAATALEQYRRAMEALRNTNSPPPTVVVPAPPLAPNGGQ